MDRTSLISTVVVGTISASIGYFFSLWRTRIRPWIALEGFSTGKNVSEQVTVSQEFVDASKSFWLHRLNSTDVRLEDFNEIFSAADEWLELSNQSEQVATAGIQQLRAATSDAESISALYGVLNDPAIPHAIYLAADWNNIEFPDFDKDRPRQIPFYIDEQNDPSGQIVFDFPESLFALGTGLSNRPPLADKLTQFAEIVSRLEVHKISDVLQDLTEALRRQRDTARFINEEGAEIDQMHSRWQCIFSVTNFGATPFIMFPEESVLVVRSKSMKPIRLPCSLVGYDDESDGWTELTRVVVTTSGTTQNLICVTKTLREIDQADMLRGVFKKGDAQAVVIFSVMSQGLPWKRTIRSTPIPFKDI